MNEPLQPPVTEYLYRKAARAGIALSGTFELTPVCNMDCKMCYVRLPKQAQQVISPLATARQWLDLAKKARDAGMLYLLLTGGEPFSHPEFRQILEGLHQMGFVITVNTNGTLIDEAVVRWLKTCPPVRINISLYGVSDGTYERLCGNPRGFSQVCKALRLLKNAGIGVKLNCSLTPHNASDLEGIVKLAKEQALPLQVATYMFPPVRKDAAMVGQNDRFSPEDAAWYTAYAAYLQEGKERFLFAQKELKLPEEPEECAKLGDGIRCRAGKCSFWVTWQGKLLPCGMFAPGNAANVFDTDFASAWEALKEETAQIRLPAACSGCNLQDTCRACAAMVYTESGNFGDVPRYRCEMSRAYPGQYEKLVQQIKEGQL